MSKHSKPEIQAAIDSLQKASRRLEKKTGMLASAINDAAQFRTELEAIGEPDYRDEAAITRQVVLERKLKSCESMIERSENEDVAEAAAQLSRCIIGGGEMAADLLGEIYGRRVETITAALRPFFADEPKALLAAKQTDAAVAASSRITQLRYLALRAPAQHPAASPAEACALAKEVEEILGEALKKTPYLLKFLDYAPGGEAAAAQSNAPQEAAT